MERTQVFSNYRQQDSTQDQYNGAWSRQNTPLDVAFQNPISKPSNISLDKVSLDSDKKGGDGALTFE
jgi:hypothetical protein